MYHWVPVRFLFRNLVSVFLVCVLIGFVSVLEANTSGELKIDLRITNNPGTELQLDVREAPLSQVLESVVLKTLVPIHYSVLPEGLVTATCVGSALKQILECLLDRKADVIFRYISAKTEPKTNSRIAEAWILGSKLTGTDAINCQASLPYVDESEIDINHEQDIVVEELLTKELLNLAKSKSPEERADAIGQLLANGREDDPEIKAALEEALTDQDANVRAQAVSTFTHREGADAMGVIQNALHDSSPEVRMMAVDSISNDAALLQQAVNDSDETVRNLAVLKLEQLTQGGD